MIKMLPPEYLMTSQKVHRTPEEVWKEMISLMQRYRIICLGVLFVFALSLIVEISPGHAADEIKIGIVLPLTGTLAKIGEIERKSFKMAIDEINATAGVNRKKLHSFIEDTSSRPDVGRAMVEKLIKKYKVQLVSGGCSSSVVYAVAHVCQQNQIPFLVSTAAADKITASGRDYVFRLNPPFSKYASGMESLFSEIIRPRTAVILHEDSRFGAKRAKSFANICKRLHMKVLMNEKYEYGEIDFIPVLTKMKDKNPDIIYMIAHAMDASLLMGQAKDLQLTPKMFIGGAQAFSSPAFQQDAGIAAENVIAGTLWHQKLPFPEAMDFYRKFKARYHMSVDYHGAEAYAACQVIADVLNRTKSSSNTDIQEALRNTDMTTVFGPVRFTTWGKMKNQNKALTYVVQWINGKLEIVWPKKMATKHLVYPVNWLKNWGY